MCVWGGGGGGGGEEGGGGGGGAGEQKVYIGWLYGQQGKGAGGTRFRKLIIISN